MVYPRTPPDDDAVTVLREASGRLAGRVEAPVVVEWTSRIDAEWYYGNVYDEDGRPLGWWEKDTRI